MELIIKHDKNKGLFYAQVNNEICTLKYKKIDENTLDYRSTFVPEPLRNQGIAGQLTQYALEFAKKNHYRVIPSCRYVQYYIDNHPEYQELI